MRTALLALVMLIVLGPVGCSTAPDTAADRNELVATSKAKLKLLESTNKNLYKLYDGSSIAVAVFPKIGKGGLIVGGAYGKGVVFDGKGKALGYCDVSQGTLGAQIGGQAYTQFIFIKDERSLQDLKDNAMELSAQVSAVAAKSDANKTANYDNGVAVIVMDAKGLMAEATVAGQKFRYIPAETYGTE